jgi:hypothetical protein
MGGSGFQAGRSRPVGSPNVDVRSVFFCRERAATLPFMDEKLMVATESLLKASLEELFQTLRSKRASRESRVSAIWNFTSLMKPQ